MGIWEEAVHNKVVLQRIDMYGRKICIMSWQVCVCAATTGLK